MRQEGELTGRNVCLCLPGQESLWRPARALGCSAGAFGLLSFGVLIAFGLLPFGVLITSSFFWDVSEEWEKKKKKKSQVGNIST